MVYRYTPILRWKRGEKVGVQHISAAGRQDVMPLFVLGTEQFVGRSATKKRAAMDPASVVAADLATLWPAGEFFVDAMALPGGTPHHALVDIASAARVLGLHLIPATRLDAPAPYQAAISTVVKADNRGVALRVDINDFASAATWLSAWPYSPSQTDLILDVSGSAASLVSFGNAIDPLFTNLASGALWRTVTIAGTSMPANFQGYAAGIYTLPRHEWALWRRLSGLNLPYRLHYGDYATVAVVPPPTGIRAGFPITVRYTLPSEFLICRGVRTSGPGSVDQDPQLVGHAQAIRGYAARHRIQCWADDRIDLIAAGTEGPQGLEHWVRLAVNRHVELTRRLLP